MSEKKDKRIRRSARHWYEMELYRWRMSQPAKWRFFKYRKWKRQMPRYADIENKIKNIAKKKV